MGYLKFKYNDKIYTPDEDYAVYGLNSENNLCLYMNTGSGSTARKYYPGFATRGTKVLVKTTDSGKTYIDNSSPSLCFKKNGTVYYVAKSKTFVAKRTVEYNANGGSGSMDSQSFYPDDGESITIKSNAFSRSGYLFEKWNTLSDGSGTSYSAGSTYKGNGMTLYAQWMVGNIPAGTYSPQTFAGLIEKFISIGGERAVKYSCSMIVNNQTYTITANKTVRYIHRYSSLSVVYHRVVQFSSGDVPVFSEIVKNDGWQRYGILLIRREPNKDWYTASITLKNPLVFK